ncbi:RiPP maturation radical SAM C-methyltransferase [Micromonospora sp. CA-263727]|uniref:RiPP maturation radical SAM C-methyltransferase n=1 Tax=Micromonospora sp. CA-263727 TaxID=3239967 RepID=UPI003D907C8E
MKNLSIVLAAMPWQSIDRPSLPVGLLRTVCADAGYGIPATYHGSTHWAEYLLEKTAGRIGPDQYSEIAEFGVFDAVGDWIFTAALYGDGDWGVAAFDDYARRHGVDRGLAYDMRSLAADYLDEAVERVLQNQPDVVGFSTTFMQNIPSLALASRIKAIDPGIRTVFGGGNCEGRMGAALSRAFGQVDYVVRGEGERAFPQLLKVIAGDGKPSAVPGLCWRDKDGQPRANPEFSGLLPPALLKMPDFDDWFAELEESPVREYVEPSLVVESARGCWWGELHHCTFCGLNGSAMTFRAKEPKTFVAELTELVRRHRVLDVMTVDNIIDNDYYDDMLPLLANLDWDLRIHYEVKSNMKQGQLVALRDAGVVLIQPGIESLVSSVLKLMDKGVSATHNIRTLRDGESAGLTVSWNWLVGFPGEIAADYEAVLPQVKALVHLQPPMGVSRIALERFSPYFDRPELGFPERRPAEIYKHVYDLDKALLQDLVYLFDTDDAGIDRDLERSVGEAIKAWQDGYPESSLTSHVSDSAIRILDRRVGWDDREHLITDERLMKGYLLLEHGHTRGGLARKLEDSAVDVSTVRLDEWLADLRRLGLVFHENGRFIALATRNVGVKV